jgi:hypothetical protein
LQKGVVGNRERRKKLTRQASCSPNLPNSTDSQRDAFREKTRFLRLQAIDQDANFAETANQLILFDF